MNEVKDKRFKEVLFSQEEIESKVAELALWVDGTYKNSQNLLVIGLLKGSILFLAELMKHIKTDLVLDFMTISSYGENLESSQDVKFLMDLKQDVANRDVLIVEDLIDTGLTILKVKEALVARNPKSLKVLTLLDKKEGRTVDLEADKVGFVVPNLYIVGYGIDAKEKLRNVPYIGVFNTDYYDKL